MRVLVFFDSGLELFQSLQVGVSRGMARICARGMGRHGRRLVLIFGGVGRGTVAAAGREGGAAPVKGASGASGRHGGRGRFKGSGADVVDQQRSCSSHALDPI